jgi:DNA-binding NarL/FixJ family response regulator
LLSTSEKRELDFAAIRIFATLREAMQRLGTQESERVMSFLAEAHSTSAHVPLTTELLDHLASLVGCLSATYAERDHVPSPADLYVPSSHELRHPPSTAEGWGDNPFSLSADSLSAEHSIGRWSGMLDRGRRLRFETTSWAAEYGVVDCLWHVFPLTPGRMATLVLHRQERDFGEREEAIVEAVVPHVTVLIRNSRMRRTLADLVATLGSDHRGGAIVLLGEGRTIEQLSPAAAELLDKWFGSSRDDLPEPIADWHSGVRHEPLRIERDGTRLVVEAPSPITLALAEESVLVSRLTTRELEILRSIAAGRTTKEIASHLWITQATVSKHLERIYRKLGVTSRTAALSALGMSRF